MVLEDRLRVERLVRDMQFRIAAKTGSRRLLIKQRDEAELMRREAEEEIARLKDRQREEGK